MSPERARSFLRLFESAKPRQVFLGSGGVHLVEPADLDDAQVGYSRAPDGADLTGDSKGDWLPSWLVIGQEMSCGDPIFVDLATEGFPLFTAAHGMGTWTPNPLASSFTNFVQDLQGLARLSAGRSTPVDLEGNPIFTQEQERFLDAVQLRSPTADREFCAVMLEID